MGSGAYRFTKEDDVRFHEAVAFRALCDLPRLQGVPHLVAVIFAVALYAVLTSEATVCFNDFVTRYACAPLKRVNVLREACVEELMVVEEAHEGVGRSWSEASWK